MEFNELNQFKKWIFKTAQNNLQDFKITTLSWAKDNHLPLYDFEVLVKINSLEFQGRGTDENQDLALCKAVSEAYERYCVSILGLKNSNGCSAHLNIDLAIENAKKELIERDCFLYQFISNQGYKKMSSSKYKIANVNLENYLLSTKNVNVVLSRILIDDYMQVFGLGTDGDLLLSVMAAEIEALRQWAYLQTQINGQYQFKSDPKSFDDHGNSALTHKYFDLTKHLFEDNQSTQNSFVDLDQRLFKISNFNIEKTLLFKNCPLHFVKVEHLEAQPLFIGVTLNNLNKSRFANLKLEELNLCPHPFR